MKKLILTAMILGITACSNPVQQSTVPMDMQTVQEYQQRVANAKVNRAEAKQPETYWELDRSDKKPKVVVVQQPRVYPSMHYGYGWGRYHRHHSGVGVRLGGYY